MLKLKPSKSDRNESTAYMNLNVNEYPEGGKQNSHKMDTKAPLWLETMAAHVSLGYLDVA